MYTNNNNNFITKKRFQVAPTKQVLVSSLSIKAPWYVCRMAPTWVPTKIVHTVIYISSCELKSILKTWLSWKVVASCIGNLQKKQQAIICLYGYELTTANLFETALWRILQAKRENLVGLNVF